VRRADLLRAEAAVFRLKTAHARYFYLRRAAGALASITRRERAVRIWPPFDEREDAQGLDLLKGRIRHYLGGTGCAIAYYVRADTGHTNEVAAAASGVDDASGVDAGMRECSFDPETGRTREERIVPAKLAHQAVRRAKCCALWRADRFPRAGSLRPHLYFIAEDLGGLAASEWLRLLSDIYHWNRTIPQRPALFPPYPVRSCAVLGGGPSLDYFHKEADRWDAWIAGNFVSTDERLRRLGHPFAVCALDPHCFAPLESQRPLWNGVFGIVRETPAVFVTTQDSAPFIELHFPADVRKKTCYAKILGHNSSRPFTRFDPERLVVTGYGNVLTDLMLPLAASISERVILYGCDGAPPGHGSNFPKSALLQKYDDEQMQEFGNSITTAATYQSYFERNSMYVRHVADECLRRGVVLELRRPSWNRGLQHLPVLEENLG
jgi:hypothetical protein